MPRLTAAEKRALEQALSGAVAPALELGTSAERLHAAGMSLLGKLSHEAPSNAVASTSEARQAAAVAELQQAFGKALNDATLRRRQNHTDAVGGPSVLLGHVGQSLLSQSADAATHAAFAAALAPAAGISQEQLQRQHPETQRTARRVSMESIPGGDEVLGRLLKDVLRHKAKDTQFNISHDGWMTVDDVLVYVNSFGHEYDEAAIRQEVADNPKRRFQLHDTNAGIFIRAAQGHTMHGTMARV